MMSSPMTCCNVAGTFTNTAHTMATHSSSEPGPSVPQDTDSHLRNVEATLPAQPGFQKAISLPDSRCFQGKIVSCQEMWRCRHKPELKADLDLWTDCGAKEQVTVRRGQGHLCPDSSVTPERQGTLRMGSGM